MAVILSIANDVVSIGMDDGSISEVRTCDLNFAPSVGDKVQVFQNETKTIVSKIEKEEPSQTSAASGVNINVSNSASTNVAPTYVANGKKAVNKVVYCLLAFFLGGIGIHKFYAGKIGTGILYIIFCWTFIPEIISLIEFIIALCKKSDANGMILV